MDDPSVLFNDPSEYRGFAESVAPYYRQYDTRLNVLVWGPGETAKRTWWEKRANLVETLRMENPGDDVDTSEDLFRQLGDPPIEYGRFEVHHAETADIILALVLASPRTQGGVYRELEIIADRYELREKTYIFLPRDVKTYQARFQVGALRAYRDNHKFYYPWSVLTTCDKVTATALNLVGDERNQRMYRVMESSSRNP
jgi:hypothetical protein